jgi:hypothetical protein
VTLRERPILFSAPMVRALLAGTKTQTRRVIAKQPPPECGITYQLGNESWIQREKRSPIRRTWEAWHGALFESRPERYLCGAFEAKCPFGMPGDRLWVRETHAQLAVGEGLDTPVPQCVAYRATCEADGGLDYVNGRGEIMRLTVTKWTPAIYMPRWASRITLEITDIRSQRVQDISAEDSLAEGVPRASECGCETCRRSAQMCPADASEQVMAYAALWEHINGKRPGCGWDANPWVWCVSFRRVEDKP